MSKIIVHDITVFDGFAAELTWRPFDKTLIELIKDMFPGNLRGWNGDAKRWAIRHEGDLQDFLAVAMQRGHGVEDLRQQPKQQQQQKHQQQPPPRAKTNGVATWADGLFDAVGPARAKPVYRAVSKVLHPDVETGDHVLMQQLNRAYTKRY